MSHDVEDNGYNDSNRAFLQAFLARGSMTFAEAKPILAAIFSAQEGRPVQPEDITNDDLVSYIAAANTAISPFDLEIRSTLRQTSSASASDDDDDDNNGRINGQSNRNGERSAPRPERVYALVNTTSDPLAQLATTYSADEIAFLKRVLDAIFETYNTRRSEAMVITGTQAMQLAKASSDAARRESGLQNGQSQGTVAQSLSMTQAETVMKRLVEEGWLEKSRRGFYSLSPRALMELRGWLVATYNEDSDEGRGRNDKIKFCAACKDIITVGQRCANRDCPGRLHDHCIQNFFRMQRAEKCPVCKAAWPNDKFVGERAITTTDLYQQGRRRSTNVRRTFSTHDAVGDDAGSGEDSG